MAIFLALRSPEVEVIGLTTIYGNVYTTLATRNALHLVTDRSFYSDLFFFHDLVGINLYFNVDFSAWLLVS